MKLNSQVPAGLKRFAETFILIAMMISFDLIFDKNLINDPDFGNHPFWYKLLMVVLMTEGYFFILYINGAASEVILILSGFGYKKKTEKEDEQFNTVRCIKIWEH